MTTIIETEPEVQAAPGKAPPRRPQRTAVGTDDEERRPCRHCGHTKTQHLGPSCRALVSGPQFTTSPPVTFTSTGTDVVSTSSSGPSRCGCRNYEPKKG